MFLKFIRAIQITKKEPLERRKHFRVDVKVPVTYFVIPRNEEEKIKHYHRYKANSRNISGGGLLIEIPVITDELFLTSHFIKIQFSISKNINPIEAVARIVSVEKAEDFKGFYVRLAFIKIDKEEQKRLIDYLENKHKKA